MRGIMIITTTDTIPGATIEQTLGFVSGNNVKARNAAVDMLAGLKTIVGGEIASYTKLMNDTRQVAIDRMVQEAQAMGANAIVGVRLASSEVMQGCCELCAYGTAVVIS